LPDRSNLPLPAAQLILEKKREAEVRDDVRHERYGGRALCAGCRTRDIEDTFTDEAGRRLLSRAAVSEMTGVRVVHDPRPANEIARRGVILDVHIAF